MLSELPPTGPGSTEGIAAGASSVEAAAVSRVVITTSSSKWLSQEVVLTLECLGGTLDSRAPLFPLLPFWSIANAVCL